MNNIYIIHRISLKLAVPVQPTCLANARFQPSLKLWRTGTSADSFRFCNQILIKFIKFYSFKKLACQLKLVRAKKQKNLITAHLRTRLRCATFASIFLLLIIPLKSWPCQPKLVRAKVGVPGWSRTNDLRIRSPSLYPTELRAQVKITSLFVWFDDAHHERP